MLSGSSSIIKQHNKTFCRLSRTVYQLRLIQATRSKGQISGGQSLGYSSDLVSIVMRSKGQGQDNLDKNSLSVSPSFLDFLFSFPFQA